MKQQTNIAAVLLLKQQISAGRRRLNDLWNVHGTSNAAVLAASAELDHLINQYHRLKQDGAGPGEYHHR